MVHLYYGAVSIERVGKESKVTMVEETGRTKQNCIEEEDAGLKVERNNANRVNSLALLHYRCDIGVLVFFHRRKVRAFVNLQHEHR